mmetsp:Transcript_7315/g.17823  ORF Transcript_7315/g.17823 Transcript_7315/m.17823 type:complete len:123 (+) Transcript_7315:227-595(+)
MTNDPKDRQAGRQALGRIEWGCGVGGDKMACIMACMAWCERGRERVHLDWTNNRVAPCHRLFPWTLPTSAASQETSCWERTLSDALEDGDVQGERHNRAACVINQVPTTCVCVCVFILTLLR